MDFRRTSIPTPTRNRPQSVLGGGGTLWGKEERVNKSVIEREERYRREKDRGIQWETGAREIAKEIENSKKRER